MGVRKMVDAIRLRLRSSLDELSGRSRTACGVSYEVLKKANPSRGPESVDAFGGMGQRTQLRLYSRVSIGTLEGGGHLPWLRLVIDFSADNNLVPWRRSLEGGVQGASVSVEIESLFTTIVDAGWLSSWDCLLPISFTANPWRLCTTKQSWYKMTTRTNGRIEKGMG